MLQTEFAKYIKSLDPSDPRILYIWQTLSSAIFSILRILSSDSGLYLLEVPSWNGWDWLVASELELWTETRERNCFCRAWLGLAGGGWQCNDCGWRAQAQNRALGPSSSCQLPPQAVVSWRGVQQLSAAPSPPLTWPRTSVNKSFLDITFLINLQPDRLLHPTDWAS